MRKLFGLVVAVALSVGVSSSASAVSLEGSSLTLIIGALPDAVIDQPAGKVPVAVAGDNSFFLPGSVMTAFKPNNIVPGTALFTGVSLISSLSLTIANGSGSMAPGGGFGGGFGGAAPLAGGSVVGILGGLINLNIPLSIAGAAGTNTVAVFAKGLTIIVTGMSWTTGTGKITAIATTTPNGAVVNTVTVTGSDNRTAGGVGTVSLISPTRVLTSAAGNLPAPTTMVLKFVPEPGAAVLLVSVMAGLAVLGYRRNRN